jgi:hypothetical protein
MGAETAVQGALYSALAALGLTVYDVAPQAADGASTATFPYIEVGAIIFADFDDKTVNGFDFVARIHTRSRSGSMAEAKGIQSQIYTRLHNGDLTVTGQRTILLRRENSFCDRLTDGSFHGVCEYRGLIETL